MSRKKVFKTAEEVVEYLFSEELESEMIVLPPEVDEFTDEEGFDDSETLDPSVRDVICPIIWTLSEVFPPKPTPAVESSPGTTASIGVQCSALPRPALAGQRVH
ncbi:hypothetical protein NPIL_262111 [Nephila pilipes]|uniref:Uncharacterized protein n=1 Tax=Nephila pilipes TaxID=299642 RepID=A0A8X6QM55_NEPPI|nr:hypothetical protein NPIL_262111 [Nephila pilipes]